MQVIFTENDEYLSDCLVRRVLTTAIFCSDTFTVYFDEIILIRLKNSS